MEFLTAFLLGGILCITFQFIAQVTKLDVPELLIIGLVIGALCGTFGFAGAMVEYGGAGFAIMVIGAGQALAESTQLALMGMPTPLIVLFGVIVALTLIGIVIGMIYRAMHKGEASQGNSPTTE